MALWTYRVAALSLALAVAAPLAAQEDGGKLARLKSAVAEKKVVGAPAVNPATKQETPASAVQWVKNYDEALKQAVEQKKQLFVFVRRHC